MPEYIAHVGIESPISESTEDEVSTVMGTFDFGKDYKADGGGPIRLGPWLYEGQSPDDERTVAVRLQTMLHAATGLELAVLVMQADNSHIAHTQGSLIGIAHLDPDIS